MPDLLPILEAAWRSAAARAGRHLVCRPGCAECCHGVFPISQQDAQRLRAGLQLLSHQDPARADRIRLRTADLLLQLDPTFPGDPATGLLPDFTNPANAALAEAFDDFANDEPCPVLDPETRTCDLYHHRPTLCRTFGPPARTEEGHLGHCELCFTQATESEITAAELDPTLPTRITLSDQHFDTEHHTSGETLIPYALRHQ